MEDSVLVEAPHTAPKLKPCQPTITYGAGMTTLKTPAGVLMEEPEDRWADTISETVQTAPELCDRCSVGATTKVLTGRL